MTYSQQLRPWCVIRTLPNNMLIVVARFRHRDDAVAYLQVLQNLVKDVAFMIIFDSPTVKSVSRE